MKLSCSADCPRCGGRHNELELHPLDSVEDNPYTHWASCPVNGQPILMRTLTEHDAPLPYEIVGHFVAEKKVR